MSKKSTFIKWIYASFSIILSFSAIIGVFQYHVMKNRYKQDLLSSRWEIMNQLDFTINYYFLQETDSMSLSYRIVESIKNLPNFYNIKSPILNGIGYMGVDVINRLANVVNYGTYIDSLQLYFPKGEIILSNTGIKYLISPLNFDNKKYDWLPIEEFDDDVPKKWLYNNQGHINKAQNQEVFTLLCTLPLLSTGKDISGYMMINFNKDELFGAFSKNSRYVGDTLLVFNEKMDLIYNNSSATEVEVFYIKENLLSNLDTSDSFTLKSGMLNRMGVFFLSFMSPYNNWRYVIVSPHSSYHAYIESYLMITITITLFALLFATILSVFISRKLYKPIQALTERALCYLDTSKQVSRYKNEYDLINECFSTLDRKCSKANDYIKANSYLIKCGIFFSLTNNTDKLTDINKVLSDLNVSFSTDIFTLMRINLNKPMEFIKMAEIEKIMSFYAPCLCITQQQDYLVFLLNLPDADDYINRYISKLKTEIQYVTGYAISCMVINTYNDLSFTYMNLQVLNELAKYSYIFDKSIIITPTLVKNNLSNRRHMLDLYYMIDDFINSMKSGNFENTSIKIDDLIGSIKLNVPEINITEMLTSYIIILINRLSEQFDIALDHTLFENYSKATSLDDYGVMLKHTSSKVISLIEGKKNEQRGSLIKNIVSFMEKNLDTVTLQLLSEQFSINKTYLSEIFIKELGINYSDVLKDLKIERAKELLKTGKASSRDVAEKVGYSNSKYFAQLFKISSGYTPKEYLRAVAARDLK